MYGKGCIKTYYNQNNICSSCGDKLKIGESGKIYRKYDKKGNLIWICNKCYQKWDPNKQMVIISDRRKYNRERLIKNLQIWVKENDRLPKAEDLKYPNPHYDTYRKEFGSLNNALIDAGIDIEKYSKQKLTEKHIELINKLQEWVKDNGKMPVANDLKYNPNYPSRSVYIKEFGSWDNSLIAAGFTPNNHENARGRQGELQTITEFKTKGAIDLSGQNRNSICDGQCPQGYMFDTKSSSLIKHHGYWCWKFSATIGQLEEAEYLFLRAYKDRDFSKEPEHKWRIPIDFMDNRTAIFVYKDKRGIHNIENMKKYEISEVK